MSIPIFRFPQDAVEQEALQALATAAASDRIVLGPNTAGFEAEFAAYCGTEHCVGVANGSDALELALRALSVGAGDTVVLAANAGFYGSIAVRAVGASPLYVDVADDTLTLCPTLVESALAQNASVKCIIVTHLYGRLGQIEEIVQLAKRRGIAVVEDCAQSHGASRGGKRAGSFGDIACFSFYPTKNLGATGDGGALITRSDQHAATLRSLRTYGWSAKYSVDLPGGRNSRLDEIQAAALRVRLRVLDARNAARRAIALRYTEALTDLALKAPQRIDEGYVAHLYVVRHPQRDAIRRYLSQQGIGTDIHYPIPDHRQSAYSDVAHARLPVTESACDEVFSLPCFPAMSDSEVSQVVSAVRDAVSACTHS